MSERSKTLLQRGALLGSLLALWALIAEAEVWPSYLFPAPWDVATSLGQMMADGRLLTATSLSVRRLFTGYILAVAIGLPVGLAIARFKLMSKLLKPVVVSLQALPSICWLPLAILWFGLDESAIIFVVVMGSVLSVAISTEDGVNSIQPQLLQVAGTLGIRGMRFFGGVLLPGAMPGIVTGLKLGWSFAWRALMAGELLFVSGGLGQLLTTGRELMEPAQVVAVMFAIVAVGVLADRLLFRVLEVRVRRRWGLQVAT